MPRGVYDRKALAKKDTTANFLPKGIDLNRSYAYYHKQFTESMNTVVDTMGRIAYLKTKMDAIHEMVQESINMAKETKFKNRHQIQKICPYCHEPKDPRGYAKHIVKCAKGKKLLKA